MKHNKELRHMVNILESQYKIISDYCNPRNLIIGKWMTSVCISYISNSLSGSKSFNKKENI